MWRMLLLQGHEEVRWSWPYEADLHQSAMSRRKLICSIHRDLKWLDLLQHKSDFVESAKKGS
jgi:hypothetical protein